MQRPKGWSSGNCGDCDGTREAVFEESHKEPSLLRYGPWSSLETHRVRSVFLKAHSAAVRETGRGDSQS